MAADLGDHGYKPLLSLKEGIWGAVGYLNKLMGALASTWVSTTIFSVLSRRIFTSLLYRVAPKCKPKTSLGQMSMEDIVLNLALEKIPNP